MQTKARTSQNISWIKNIKKCMLTIQWHVYLIQQVTEMWRKTKGGQVYLFFFFSDPFTQRRVDHILGYESSCLILQRNKNVPEIQAHHT